MSTEALPKTFPPGTEFADVEGTPVTLDRPSWVATAWDVEGGRRFSSTSYFRNGTPMSQAEFRAFLSGQGVTP